MHHTFSTAQQKVLEWFFVVVSFPKQSLFVFINFLMIVIIILFYFFRMSIIKKKKKEEDQCQRSFCVNRVQSWAFVTLVQP